jgi:hypothetical protein
MRPILPCALLCAIVIPGGSAAERWIHVRIAEEGERTDVRINVPLSVAIGFLGTVDPSDWAREVEIGEHESFDARELRQILTALEDAPDSEMITIRDGDDELHVAKERGFLIVRADERDGDRLRLRLPLKVLQAAFVKGSDELDLAAALDALGGHGESDLVTIEGDTERVRIWVDANQSGGD